MSSRLRPCCVPGCTNKNMRRFAMPKDDAVRKVWLQRIGNEKLLAVPESDYNILKNYRVCGNHFDDICKNPNESLLNNSLPTLNLSNYHGPSNRETCFLHAEPEIVKYITPEKVREALTSTAASSDAAENGTKVKTPVKTFGRPTQRGSKKILYPICESTEDPGPSTSSGVVSSQEQMEMESLGVSYLPSTSQCEKQSQTIDHTKPTRGFLSLVGATREAALSPDARTFYRVAKKLQKKAMEKSMRLSSTQKKLKYLQKNPHYLDILKNVNETTRKFFLSQTRNQQLKPRGRRFSIDDKILALSVYKQSGKCYRFLSQIFSLPSRKVLSALLNTVPLSAGINEAVFKHIKKRQEKMKILDKYCVLMFDEVALEPGLQYNQKHDCIDGFVDMGDGERRCAFADHAMVFLIKGIASSWKMPIGFVFCEGTTSTPDLTRLLKSMIRTVTATGLSVVATICDQGATNQATVNSLMRETDRYFLKEGLENKLFGYIIDGEEIIHLYDFPHLMKGIRNALLEHDLHFTQDGVRKVASWSHVMDLYRLDKNRGAYSQFKKIGDEHIIPEKIKKMRVTNCTQIFSFTYASTMKLYADYSRRLESTDELYLSPEASDTADLLLFFDVLFDSVNGSASSVQPGKQLRGLVTEKSDHLSVWRASLPVLRSMFYTKKSKQSVTPSIKNWCHNIEASIYLRSKLFSLGFKRFAMRNFNQDPIENFFSCVRSHGVRNNNPNCSAFVSTYKTLLINNLVSRRTIGANCEEDESSGVLFNLRAFLTGHENISFIPPQVQSPVFPSTSSEASTSSTASSFIADYTNAYVSGYVAKKILDQGKCKDCIDKMCTAQELPANILIRERQYKGYKLAHPSSNFSVVFKKSTELLLNSLPAVITGYGLKQKLRNILKSNNYDITSLFCPKHVKNVEVFINTTVNIVLHNYITNINKILKGKDLRNPNSGDYIRRLAFTKHAKRYTRRNKN